MNKLKEMERTTDRFDKYHSDQQYSESHPVGSVICRKSEWVKND